ncbi:hypothetical protein CRUP_018543 [Coryphaenoides rupestris]|nr:hypothetical protein CRUP_018543 [Coryphaenoides rupestris]
MWKGKAAKAAGSSGLVAMSLSFSSSASWSLLALARRFWNQILTCVSVRLRDPENSALSAMDRAPPNDRGPCMWKGKAAKAAGSSGLVAMSLSFSSSASWSLLALARRFWNQILTCVSVRLRDPENSALSAMDRYCFCRNLLSRDSSWDVRQLVQSAELLIQFHRRAPPVLRLWTRRLLLRGGSSSGRGGGSPGRIHDAPPVRVASFPPETPWKYSAQLLAAYWLAGGWLATGWLVAGWLLARWLLAGCCCWMTSYWLAAGWLPLNWRQNQGRTAVPAYHVIMAAGAATSAAEW